MESSGNIEDLENMANMYFFYRGPIQWIALLKETWYIVDVIQQMPKIDKTHPL